MSNLESSTPLLVVNVNSVFNPLSAGYFFLTAAQRLPGFLRILVQRSFRAT